MTENRKTVSREYVRDFRSRHHLTQSELADLLNVSKKTVESWESLNRDITGSSVTAFELLENMLSQNGREEKEMSEICTYDFSRFGTKLFDKKRIREALQKKDYIRYQNALEHKEPLDQETAEKIACAMKNWAVRNGCTHYTHWFHPLNGSTAEKHNAFVEEKEGKAILAFSGKSLIKDEPDASSFPSGGLRETFEARGYTYWDIHSPVFIRGHVLYIPTVFVSYTGESLDTKGPLLKSIEAVSESASRIVSLLTGEKINRVEPCTGLEQEFFLVDKDIYLKRRDLFLTGKTLFGGLPSKGQELEKHYFGSIPERVNDYLEDVNAQLWDLGIYIKNEHNETAPGQFEMSPIYTKQNIAIDQNMVMMDIMQKTALKHNLVCLLHEAPFKGVNGSGKHNNYSLITDDGQNLFDPGKYPKENIRFMLMTAALIRAVDDYADMIRLSSSDSGNDFRLGANEAPPAIVSIYLGEAIENMLRSLSNESEEEIKKGKADNYLASIIQNLPRDNSDRNRTSPIAFTGNKFEFRMLGSSLNPSFLNTVINTAMAKSLDSFYEQLSSANSLNEIADKAMELIRDTYLEHKRILYSGNGYSNEWKKTATDRGLENIPTFYEAIAVFARKKNVELFEEYGIYSSREIEARSEIMYESYANIRKIEAGTLTSMVYRNIIPSAIQEMKTVTEIKEEYMAESMRSKASKLRDFIDESSLLAGRIEDILKEVSTMDNSYEKGKALLKEVLPLQDKLRSTVDLMEHYISQNNMPCPGYEELFFNIDN